MYNKYCHSINSMGISSISSIFSSTSISTTSRFYSLTKWVSIYLIILFIGHLLFQAYVGDGENNICANLDNRPYPPISSYPRYIEKSKHNVEVTSTLSSLSSLDSPVSYDSTIFINNFTFPSTYFIGILYKNNIHLLIEALHSLSSSTLINHIIIIDNSNTLECIHNPTVQLLSANRIYIPSVPLSFTQAQNVFQKWAITLDYTFFMVMHSDIIISNVQEFYNTVRQKLYTLGIPIDNTFTSDIVLSSASTSTASSSISFSSLPSSRWGAIFTNYDSFIIFHTEAIKQVGPWDTFYFHYVSDNDYYNRLHNQHYYIHTLDNSLSFIHHITSNTLKYDLCYKIQLNLIYDYQILYYYHKWGKYIHNYDYFEINTKMYTYPFQKLISNQLLYQQLQYLAIISAFSLLFSWYIYSTKYKGSMMNSNSYNKVKVNPPDIENNVDEINNDSRNKSRTITSNSKRWKMFQIWKKILQTEVRFTVSEIMFLIILSIIVGITIRPIRQLLFDSGILSK